jgi:hypothetical protein
MLTQSKIDYYVKQFALRSGCDPVDVDPYKTHYVTGLESLHWGNDPESFKDLDLRKQGAVLRWIHRTFEPATSTKSCLRNSYGLKHWFGNEVHSELVGWRNPEGFYITNGQFKGAMIVAGYEPDDLYECNPCYKVKIRQEVRDAIRAYRTRRNSLGYWAATSN